MEVQSGYHMRYSQGLIWRYSQGIIRGIVRVSHGIVDRKGRIQEV